MLSPQDISKLLGVTVQGKSTGKDPQMGDCSWENPSKPGPDGMRLMGGGTVEFAAGNRVNTIQVAVVRLSSDQANSAAIDLARKIGPQVPN
jgi:hypothetical protein